MAPTDHTPTTDGEPVPPDPRPDPSSRETARWRAWAGRARASDRLRDAAVVGVYLMATALLFRPVIRHPRWYLVGTNMADDTRFVWAYAWMDHALANHLNPFLTDLQYAAVGGINTTANTTVLLPALLLAPVTALAGPVASANLQMVTSPLIAAVATYATLRRWSTRAGAALGGWTYGFSTYLLVKLLGHANLVAAAALAPLLALVVTARPGGTRRQAALGGAAGVLLAALVYTSIEVAATTAVFVASVAAVAAATGQWRAGCADLAARRVLVGVAALTTVVLAAPFAGFYLLGPEVPYRDLQPAHLYDLDLAELVVPTDVQLLSPPRGQTRANAPLDQAFIDRGDVPAYDFPWSGADTEWVGFVGLPLVVLTVWVLARPRPSAPIERLAATAAVVATVLALGSTLHVNGRDTGVLMPWSVFDRLPLLHNAIAARMMQYAFGALALLVALQFPRLRRGEDGADPGAGRGGGTRVPGRRAVLAAAGALVLVPAAPLALHPVPTYPGIDGLAALPACHGPASAVVFLPSRLGGRDELGAQVAAGMSFRLARGSAFRASPVPDLALDRLVGDDPPPGTVDRAEAAAQLGELGATCVALSPAAEPERAAVALLSGLAGRPPTRTGDYLVWTRPEGGWGG